MTRTTWRRLLATLVGTALTLPLAPAPAVSVEEPSAASTPASGRFVPLPLTELVLNLPLLEAGKTANGQFWGVKNIPAGATAVSATVAVGPVAPATAPTADGSLRAWAAGDPVPSVSTLFFFKDEPWASTQSVIRLGANGQASFFNNSLGNVRVTVVVDGYYTDADDAAGTRLVALPQQRILDTRDARPDRPAGTVPANGGTVDVAVAGKGGLPAASSIGAVVLNVTVVSPAQNGSWRVYPKGGQERYGHGNFVRGRHKAQTLVTTLPASGLLTIKNLSSGTAHYLAEVVGYYPVPTSTAATARVIPVRPQRLLDTATANGVGTTTPVPANGTITARLGGRAGTDIPGTGLSMIALLLSTRSATAAGHLIAYPYGGTLPAGASDVQFPAGRTAYNLVWARVSADGRVQIRNGSGGTVHLWGDVVAYTLAATVPDQPTRVVATSGDTRATVSWAAPFDGGARIITYQVTATPGGATKSVAGTTATLDQLTNGTAYTFRITATNAVGTSTASAPTDEVIPAAPRAPGRPLIIDVFPRDSEARVTWSPPDTRAAGLTKYVVAASPGTASVEAPPEATEIVVPGLTNGTPYSFTVTAVNGNGSGEASPASTPIRPRRADVPVKPLIGTVIALNGRIDLQWAPTADGGSDVTGYTVTAQPGGTTVNTPANTTAASLEGLTNGTAYTISVVARNKSGASPAATTGPVTPAAARVPASPVDLRAGVAATGSVKLSWSAPVDVGTAAITSYTVLANDGSQTTRHPSAGTSTTVTGLDPGKQYTFGVSASNAHGSGPTSPATEPITPKLTVKATPKVLTGAALQTLRTVHGDGTLDFEQPPGEITGLTAGTIIVVTAHPKAPRGLLRKVTGVTKASGLTVVSTEPAGLDEMIDDGSLSVDEQLTAADLQTFTPAGPAIRLRAPMIAGRTLRQGARAASSVAPGSTPLGLNDDEFSVELEQEFGSGGSLHAMLGLKPILNADIKIAAAVPITHWTVGTRTRAAAGGITVGVGVQGGAKASSWPIGSFSGRCFSVPIGPVPVLLCPELKMTMKIDFTGEVGVKFSAEYSRILTGEAHTAGNVVTGFDFHNEVEGSDSPGIQPFAEGEAKFGLGVTGVVYVYDTAGPGIELTPYISALIDHDANPWWEIRIGIEANFILRLKFLKHVEITQSWTLADIHYTIKRAPEGAWNGIDVTPQTSTIAIGESVGLRATHNGTPTPVRWQVIDGPGAVDAHGTYSSAEAGWAIVQALPDDPDLLSANAAIQVGAMPSDPEPQVAPAPLSLRVSWPAVTPGDSPVSSYAVTTSPPTTSTWVPATGAAHYSTYVRGLRAGVSYHVKVVANAASSFDSESDWIGPAVPTPILNRIGSPGLIAVDAFGNPDNTGEVNKWEFALSGNGRFAFFATQARSNLAPPEIYDPDSTMVHLLREDLTTGEIIVASRLEDGTTAGGLDVSFGWSSSYDGSIVAYRLSRYQGSQPVPRILVHNIAQGTTWNAMNGITEAQGTFHTDPQLSGDGNVVAFRGLNTQTQEKRFWRTQRGGVATNITGCPAPVSECEIAYSERMSLSHDGSRILYRILVARTGNNHGIPVLWQSGTLTNLMRNSRDDQIREVARLAVLSADGTKVAISYTKNYWDGSGRPAVSGVAVAPVSAGVIEESDLVVKQTHTNLDDPAYFPEGLTANGRHLVYGFVPELNDPKGLAIADTAVRTSEPLPTTGYPSDVKLSVDGRVLAWWQVCNQTWPCRPGVTPGPWVQRLG